MRGEQAADGRVWVADSAHGVGKRFRRGCSLLAETQAGTGSRNLGFLDFRRIAFLGGENGNCVLGICTTTTTNACIHYAVVSNMRGLLQCEVSMKSGPIPSNASERDWAAGIRFL